MFKRFNPRPRVGGDVPRSPRRPGGWSFNPRPRVGGDGRPAVCGGSRNGFNPRPRVGGDLSSRPFFKGLRVSIHAPAWGETDVAELMAFFDVFQSTPPRGGRPRSGSPFPAAICFNPRPRVGGDVVTRSAARLAKCFNPRPRVGGDRGFAQVGAVLVVSIHAPAWGATIPRFTYDSETGFQSTPPRGGRPTLQVPG